jgi:hypothetical protein
MSRAFARFCLLALGCLAPCGCHAVPLQQLELPPPPPVRLFGRSVTADKDSIRAAVLAAVPAGISADEARIILQTHGFECRDVNRWNLYSILPAARGREIREREWFRHDLVACTNHLDLEGHWGQLSVPVGLLLLLDESRNVRDVEAFVPTLPEANRNAAFFANHPDLSEPVGLPRDEALARMRAAGFRCREGKCDDRVGPHLLCEAFEECFLGGNVTRVRLFLDAYGKVAATRTNDPPEPFDQERCMLPSPEDPNGTYACKCVLFPVRLLCRYTLNAGVQVHAQGR